MFRGSGHERHSAVVPNEFATCVYFLLLFYHPPHKVYAELVNVRSTKSRRSDAGAEGHTHEVEEYLVFFPQLS